MKYLLLLLSAVSAKTVKVQLMEPPTDLEYGWCEGSPQPGYINKLTVSPFPIVIKTGEIVTMEALFTNNVEVSLGAQMSLELVLEGIIPIKIPCLEVNGIHLGSCLFDVDSLVQYGAPYLCPDYFPAGQDCALPLLPGTYGSDSPLVLGPIPELDIPDLLLPFLKGTIRAEVTVTDAAGETIACLWLRISVTSE